MVISDLDEELAKISYEYADKNSLRNCWLASHDLASPRQRLTHCVSALQARFSCVEAVPTDLMFLVNLRSTIDYQRMLPWLSVHDELWHQVAERLGTLRVCPIEYANKPIGQVVAFSWTMSMILNNLRLAKKEALVQLASVVEQCHRMPSIIGLGAAIPSLIEKDLYLRFRDRGICLVSGHHSTVLATIEILKRAMTQPLHSIAILGVGKIGRSAALAVAEEFSRYGLEKLYLVDPNFNVPPCFMEKILCHGIDVEKISDYSELKEADAILGFPSAVDFPLDRYLLQGGKLKSGALIINDAQPPCLSWSIASQLWSSGLRVYSVATTHAAVKTNICFEQHIGGQDNNCFYACLSEIIAVQKQLAKGQSIDRLIGDVNTERLPEIKSWHQEAGITYPLLPYGDTAFARAMQKDKQYIQLANGSKQTEISTEEKIFM
jgi:hypothetical protein